MKALPALVAALFLCAGLWISSTRAESVVVFNEIHYHPASSTAVPEFIELLNQNATDVDLSGWSLEGAVRYTFPDRTVIRGGSTLLISDQPQTLTKFADNSLVLGPYQGQLSNGGEALRLRTANLLTMDEVSYQDHEPWPEAADGTGFSLTKRGPNLNSKSPSSWKLSPTSGGSPGKIEFTILPASQILESKSSLLAFYPFDSGPQDATKNHRDGTPSTTGLVLTTNQSGFEGECYRFQGQGYIDLPLPLSPTTVPQVTLGAWVKAASLNSPARNEIISTDNGSYDRALTIDSRSGLGDPGQSRYAAFAGSTSGVLSGPPAKITDGWVFIAASFDSIFGRTTLYVQTNVFAGPASHGPSAAFTRVGAHPLGIEFFNGWIDNVFVFNRILSKEEIDLIRTGGAAGVREVSYRPIPPQEDPRRPLLALLTLDQSTVDVSGRGFNGVTNGAVQFSSPSSGFENGAVVCSGGGITIPLSLSPNTKPQITFGAWVKPTRISPTNTRHPILNTSTRSFDRGIGIDSRSGERESGMARYVAFGGDGIGCITSRAASTNDDWTFCAAVYDTRNGTTLFMVDDDVQRAEASQLSDVSNLYIGRNAAGTASFQGWIDNVFVFNRALSVEELQSIRKQGSPAILALNRLPDLPPITSIPTPYCPAGLQLNEISSSDSSPFQIELVNQGNDSISLEHFLLELHGKAGIRSSSFSPIVLLPGQVYAITLPYSFPPPARDDLLALRCSENPDLFDARHITTLHQSRISQSNQGWTHLLSPSFGSPNPATPKVPNIVINEILYHPRGEPGLTQKEINQRQWIELYNASSESVDLSGWQIQSDIQFKIPPGTQLGPDQYLVISKDPDAFSRIWPQSSAIGPFTGELKRGSSAHLVLETSEGWTVDEVTYSDGGRWPQNADGGGSSLELKNPRSDHSSAESWAASEESNRSPWTTYSYSGIAAQNPGYNIGNDQFHEFVAGMLDSAVILIDDISVIDQSSTNQVSLIQNGNFQSDLPGTIPARWRVGGNHEALGATQVVEDPDEAGNRCLRLVATGATDYLHNHLETTLKNGNQFVKIIPGHNYAISFRAKWISGTPLLNTRLYFNFIQKTHTLVTAVQSGTPGQRNSSFATNIGPSMDGMRHDPPVPSPSDPLTFQIQIQDPDQVESARLHYRINSEAWQSSEMSDSATNNLWQIQLPAQPAETRIQFFFSATDKLGAVAYFPAEGTNSCAMLKIIASPPAVSGVHHLLILMADSDVSQLYNPLLRMSNQRRPATVIYDDREIFYNVGVRLKGSAFGRNNDSETGINIEFDPNQLFRGIHSSIALERSGAGAGREILAKYFFNQAGPEIGSLFDDVTYVRMPRTSDDGMALIALSRNSEEFLQSQWNNGDEGSVWNMDLLYSPSGTLTGAPESPKLNFPYNHDSGQPDIQYLGEDKEAYRWNFSLRNHRDRDDYSALIQMTQAFELKGADLDRATTDRIDVDQWLRHFAVLSIVGNSDVYLRYWNHNLRLFQRPSDGRILVLPWDLDSSFTLDINAPLWGTSNGLGTPVRLGKVIDLPGNSRKFQGHLLDLLTRTATPGRMAQWAAHYGSLAQQDFSPHADWLIQRRRFVLSQFTRLTNFFELSATGNEIHVATNSPWMLSGKAGIEIHHMLVNGQPVKMDWNGPTRNATNFVCQIPLQPGTNTYLFETFDFQGQPFSRWSQNFTVAYLPAPTNSANTNLVLNEWMASNTSTLRDPMDQDFEDWIELHNPTDSPVDLSGYALSDDPSTTRLFVFPPNSGYFIPAHGFFLVWADGENQQNRAGVQTIHTNFKLSSEGETITLSSPNGSIIDSVTFGKQSPNQSMGRLIDGGEIISALDRASPGSSNNTPTEPKPFSLSSLQWDQNGTISWSLTTEPGVTYRLLYTDSLAPIQWVDTGIVVTGNGQPQTMQYMFPPNISVTPFRFFRVIAE